MIEAHAGRSTHTKGGAARSLHSEGRRRAATMLKKVRSKVPAWLMCVALVQLALTGWFIKSLGTVDKDSIEDLSQPEVKIIVHGIETPQSYGKDDSPTFVTTLEEPVIESTTCGVGMPQMRRS